MHRRTLARGPRAAAITPRTPAGALRRRFGWAPASAALLFLAAHGCGADPGGVGERADAISLIGLGPFTGCALGDASCTPAPPPGTCQAGQSWCQHFLVSVESCITNTIFCSENAGGERVETINLGAWTSPPDRAQEGYTYSRSGDENTDSPCWRDPAEPESPALYSSATDPARAVSAAIGRSDYVVMSGDPCCYCVGSTVTTRAPLAAAFPCPGAGGDDACYVGEPFGWPDWGNGPGVPNEGNPLFGGDSAGEPVELRYGSFYEQVPGLTLGGKGLPIDTGLRWSSRDWEKSRDPSGLGRGWVSTFGQRVYYQPAAVTPVGVAVLIREEAGASAADAPTGKRSYWVETAAGSNEFRLPGRPAMGAARFDPSGPSVTITSADGRVERFGSDGLLVAVADAFGNRTERSAASPSDDVVLETLRNARTGQALVRTYRRFTPAGGQPAWRLVGIADAAQNRPAGDGAPLRTVALQYDGALRLIAVTDEVGATMSFRYDAQGRITRVYDRNNDPADAAARFLANVYDAAAPSRVVRQTTSNGIVVEYDWAGGDGYTLEIRYAAGTPAMRFQRYFHDGQRRIVFRYMVNSTAQRETRTYDGGSGLLRGVLHPPNHSVSLSYDPRFEALQAYGDGTHETETGYDARGRVVRWRYSDGREERLERDAATGAVLESVVLGRCPDDAPNCAEASRPREVTRYAVDPTGLVTAERGPSGSTRCLFYDARGHLARAVEDAADAACPAGVKSRLGLVTTYVHDWRGALVERRAPTGLVTRWDRRGDGLATRRVTDPSGRNVVDLFEYDGHKHLVGLARAAQKPVEQRWRYAWSVVGTDESYALTRVEGPEALRVDYAYDAFGELTGRVERGVQPGGGDRTTSLAYEPLADGWRVTQRAQSGRVLSVDEQSWAGLLRATVDGRGVRREFARTPDGVLYRATEGAASFAEGGATVSAVSERYDLEYDLGRRPTKGTLGGREPAVRTYDAFGRPASETSNGQLPLTWQWDVASRRLQTTAGAGAEALTRRVSYDAVGRVTEVNEGSGHARRVTSYVYGPEGLREATDAGGVDTVYTHDVFGRLTSVVVPDAASTPSATARYLYDDLGRLVEEVDVRGVRTKHAFDGLGRRVATTLAAGTPREATERWSYAPDGRPLSYTDWGGRARAYVHDADGRTTRIDYAPLGNDGPEDTTIAYLGNDLVASVANGNGETRYSYDAANRLVRRDRGAQSVAYRYEEGGWPTRIEYGGTAVGLRWNRLGQLERLAATGSFSSATSLGYTYQTTGALAGVARPGGVRTEVATRATTGEPEAIRHFAGDAPLESQTFQNFDKLGRALSVEDRNGQTLVSFDEVGRLDAVFHAAGSPFGSTRYDYDVHGNRLRENGAVKYAYDELGQITTLAYDAAGNLLNDGATTYAYDSANRLVRSVTACAADPATCPGGAKTVTYLYDGLGRLVAQTVNGQRTDFVLDEGGGPARVLGTQRPGGATYYAYGPDGVAARWTRTGAADGPPQFALVDRQSTIRTWVDQAGQVAESLDYDVWGRRACPAGACDPAGYLGYAGEWHNPDQTLHLRARTYQPQLGRFLQRDRFAGRPADPLSSNRYVYTQNDPVHYVDPTGFNRDGNGGLGGAGAPGGRAGGGPGLLPSTPLLGPFGSWPPGGAPADPLGDFVDGANDFNPTRFNDADCFSGALCGALAGALGGGATTVPQIATGMLDDLTLNARHLPGLLRALPSAPRARAALPMGKTPAIDHYGFDSSQPLSPLDRIEGQVNAINDARRGSGGVANFGRFFAFEEVDLMSGGHPVWSSGQGLLHTRNYSTGANWYYMEELMRMAREGETVLLHASPALVDGVPRGLPLPGSITWGEIQQVTGAGMRLEPVPGSRIPDTTWHRMYQLLP